MTLRPRLSLLLLLLAAPLAQAANETYRLDPVHTRVMFAIEHAGFSQALGTISGSQGVLAFDPDDWAAARLDVEIPVARLDLGDAAWNKATLARNLLDGARFPSAHFVSSHVQAHDAHHATVTGQLTLRGVTREVALEVTLNALKRHPLPPFRRTAGFSATTTLSRSAFGLTSWPSVIGDAVQVRIEAEATLDRTAVPGTPDADAHSDTPTATKDPA